MNNSLYSNSLLLCSTSQVEGADASEMSMTSLSNWGVGGEAGVTRMDGFMRKLVNDDKLLKKLKAMAERKVRSSPNMGNMTGSSPSIAVGSKLGHNQDSSSSIKGKLPSHSK